MSGPKTGRYTLTAEQRRRLLEQLEKERQERIRLEKINNLKKKLKEYSNQFEKVIYSLKSSENEDIKNSIKLLENLLITVNAAQKLDDLNSIQSVFNDLQEKESNIQNIVLLNEKHITQKANEEIMKSHSIIQKGIQFNFENIKEKKSLTEDEYYKKIEKSIVEVSDYRLTASLEGKLNQVRDSAKNIYSTSHLKNFYALTVFPLIKECREYKEFFDKNIAYFEDAKVRLNILKKDLQIIDYDDFEELTPETLQTLVTKVKTLENLLLKVKEESYISSCIDEAMDEMGYHCIGAKEHISPKTNKRTIHELYNYSNGKVLDVSYSDNGQIIMQLGTPSTFSRDLDVLEKRELKEDMEAFCDQYVTLQNLLSRKGILAKNISLLPASEQFARIINISDYDMLETENKENQVSSRKNKPQHKIKRMGE